MNQYRYGAPADEKPLDRLVSDGGYASIFRTVACVGDSLSSGEFETRDPATGAPGYHDMFPYSWGQFMARMAGFTVYNFSRGGMTASEYCDSYAEAMGWWSPDLRAQAYIIALGVNDILNFGQEPGTVADICAEDPTKNAKTFTGYYARIIQQYKAIAPDAKFFLITPPLQTYHEALPAAERYETVTACVRALAEYFDNTYVIDLFAHAPVHDQEFYDAFYLHGHLTPTGYRLTAEQVASYMDYLIRHNYNDFKNVGFINSEVPMLC